MSRNQFRGIASTTHIDRHNERLTKEFLEQQATMFKKSGQVMWGYWQHLTTLPPTLIVTDQEVEKRDDGEYQLVIKGERFEEIDFENLLKSDVVIPIVTKQDIFKIIHETQSSDLESILIRYDPRNFDAAEISPIIASINELIPTQSDLYVRKAEIPQAVIFILLSYATGFIARLGEITADKVLEKTSLFYKEFHNRFAELVKKSKTGKMPDVIIGIPIPNTELIIEGAIEEASIESLKKVWGKLPDLYCFAKWLVERNRQNYFSQLKFLFNPMTEKWEINYLVTRDTNRVILGPRYIESSHPLHKRWEDERHNYKVTNANLAMSIGFIPDKTNN
jgi:hypothetical protein